MAEEKRGLLVNEVENQSSDGLSCLAVESSVWSLLSCNVS